MIIMNLYGSLLERYLHSNVFYKTYYLSVQRKKMFTEFKLSQSYACTVEYEQIFANDLFLNCFFSKVGYTFGN